MRNVVVIIIWFLCDLHVNNQCSHKLFANVLCVSEDIDIFCLGFKLVLIIEPSHQVLSH